MSSAYKALTRYVSGLECADSAFYLKLPADSPADNARMAALDFIRRIVNFSEASLKTISAEKLADLRKHFDLYDAGKWHDPEKRDAYIALSKRD